MTLPTPSTVTTDPSAATSSAPAALPDWLAGDTRPHWRRPSTWLISAAAVLAVGGAATAWQMSHGTPPPRFITEPLKRGDLALAISANGTLQPTRSVSLGSELSGTVAKVLVDVNDHVKKGQVLVQLDTAKFEDEVHKAQAALQSAQAAVVQARATVQEARLALARLEEVARLSGGKLPAATEMDSARATLDRARATEASAQANVIEAQATLSTNQTNLAKAWVRSPIDGVVLTRSVEPGNAVAASLQAVTLFTLAEDLSQMKLQVNVDEADVGLVQPGQRADFSVSAWPGRRYPARITRVAYGSTTTDNVVTYTTQLEVANTDGSLRPGMTASASIAAAERKSVWLVPRAALNFSPAAPSGTGPTGPGTKPGNGQAGPTGPSGGGILGMLMPRPPGGGGAPGTGGAGQGKAGAGTGNSAHTGSGSLRQIWVLEDGRPHPVEVQLGLSNGPLTEVSGEGLKEGLAVITEQQGGGRS